MILLAALLLVPGADPGGDVLAVFAAKCAGCHGPRAKKVEGNFSYVLDLNKLAGDANKVVPGKPDESNLWKLVSAGNMPPNPSGIKLTDGEKATIHDWIAAGVPAPLTPPASGGGFGPPLPPTEIKPPEESLPAHLLRWVGECHLLLLHFPVVCVLAAVLAEVLGAWRWASGVMAAAEAYCLVVGAIVAVPTMVCGWIYAAAGHGAGSPDTLFWHRWLGTMGGSLLVLTVVATLFPPVAPGSQSVWIRRVLLGVTAVVILAAAHMGGIMAFGEKFLSW